ncbi:MAG: hypothetical protein Q9194_006354 [Teloschistes cf. exilis]
MAEMSLVCGSIQSPSALEMLPQEVHDLIFQHDQVIEELNICGHSLNEHVTHLRLTEGGKGTSIPTAAHQLLQARPNIDTLTLSFPKFAPNMLTRSQGNDGYEQEHTYYQQPLKQLFAPPQPYQLAGPLSLREMNLFGVDLNDSPGYVSSCQPRSVGDPEGRLLSWTVFHVDWYEQITYSLEASNPQASNIPRKTTAAAWVRFSPG